VNDARKLPIWKGAVLPAETPRRVRLARPSAGRVVAIGAFCAFLWIPATVLLASERDAGTILVSALMAITPFLLLRNQLARILGLRREARLLREGTMALATIASSRVKATFRDAGGAEHTLTLAWLPPSVGPESPLPVVYDPAHPTEALAVSETLLEIEPEGRVEPPPLDFPTTPPVWNGVPIPAATPRRVRRTRLGRVWSIVGLATFLAFQALAIGIALEDGGVRAQFWLTEALALGLLGPLRYMSWRSERLLRWGTATNGLVVSRTAQQPISHHDAMSSIADMVVYAFADEHGRRHDGGCPVFKSIALAPGDPIPVLYDRANPSRCISPVSITTFRLEPG
jgi:hypothetical protein